MTGIILGLRTLNMKTKIALISLSVIFSFTGVTAQEMLGVVNSSRAGITGTMINPAVTVTSPFYVDINIFALDVFVENNFIYMAKDEYRFKRFLSKNPDFPTHGVDNNLIVYDYYNSKDQIVRTVFFNNQRQAFFWTYHRCQSHYVDQRNTLRNGQVWN